MSTSLIGPPSGLKSRAVLFVRALLTMVRVELRVRRTSPIALCGSFGVRFAGFTAPVEDRRPLGWFEANQWWAVECVLRFWPWGRNRPCLRRSLALGYALRRLSPSLCLEVRSTSPFRAHAWLLVQGHRLDMGDAGPLLTAAHPDEVGGP